MSQNGINKNDKNSSEVSDRPISSIPKKRQELLKWNGWGYKDSKFEVDEETMTFYFTGDRYNLSNRSFPRLKDWIETTYEIDLTKRFYSQPESNATDLPKPIINENFINELTKTSITYSDDPSDRLFRSHGHTMYDIFTLREKKISRVPDLVVWPKCHEDVVTLVELATDNDVVIIPYGGGTSVSGALQCPENETRMILSLDTSQMNRILWIDHQNLTAHIEAGIIGQDLERELAKHNLCTGHEPDSNEFSSLGGWVATRASGMKRNVYGNIEDLLVHVKMVTTKGTIERNCQVPRISSGPDIHHFILGSEGTLGVITEVTLKVRPIPQCKKYGSILFPSLETGVKFMREVARQQLKPASVRLMDSEQMNSGLAFKPEEPTLFSSLADRLVMFYLTRIKGFDLSKSCVATLLMEGNKEDVGNLERRLLEIGVKFGGINAGELNGKTGYTVTFVIAYIRDLAFSFGVLAESFETSIPWDRCLDLIRNVKDRIKREGKNHGLSKPIVVSSRVTQTYDAGACVYFYLSFSYQDGINGADPIHVYEEIERAARDEVIACGGSISHHHGVGKLRKRWLEKSVSTVGLGMLRAVKQYVDPNNIFANGNLMI